MGMHLLLEDPQNGLRCPVGFQLTRCKNKIMTIQNQTWHKYRGTPKKRRLSPSMDNTRASELPTNSNQNGSWQAAPGTACGPYPGGINLLTHQHKDFHLPTHSLRAFRNHHHHTICLVFLGPFPVDSPANPLTILHDVGRGAKK